jgi:hypothetical protein
MKKCILFFLFGSLSSLLFGQKKEIRFQYEVLDIPTSQIYVDSVIDGRIDHGCIGIIENLNKRDSIDLKFGVSAAFNNYLKFILPKEDNKKPIVLEISILSVNEYKTKTADTIAARVAFKFYSREDGSLKRIYESEYQNSLANSNGSKGYEICLRNGIGKCLTDFINSDNANLKKENNQPTLSQGGQFPAKIKDTLNKTSVRIPKEYLLTFSNSQGINATGFAFSFYSYTNRDGKGWVFPWIFTIDIMNIKPAYFAQFNFQSAKLNYYMAGISAFKKINDYFWLNLGLQLPIGSEELTDFSGHKTDNFIIGIAPTQGIYLISKSKVGIILSLGLYEKLITSEVYKIDIGIKAEIGIKF